MVGCKPDHTSLTKEYNRGPLLNSLYDQMEADFLILQESTDQLVALIGDSVPPGNTQISEIQAQFKNTYSVWVRCQLWRFDFVSRTGVIEFANTFPTDSSAILEKSNQKDYSFLGADDLGTAGFPALDFILFENSSNITNQSWNYLQYILLDFKTLVDQINANLSTSFKQNFISNNGISVGSSLGDYVNYFNQEFEFSKNYRIAIPSGIRTLGEPLPDRVEALYSKFGKELLTQSLQHLQTIFTGNGEEVGLADYLDFLDAEKNGATLSQLIQLGFEDVHSAIAPLPEGLDEASSEALVDVFQKMQNLTVLLKSDMPSKLGIQITYVDNDGD
jgi:predicted lipoprotein